MAYTLHSYICAASITFEDKAQALSEFEHDSSMQPENVYEIEDDAGNLIKINRG